MYHRQSSSGGSVNNVVFSSPINLTANVTYFLEINTSRGDQIFVDNDVYAGGQSYYTIPPIACQTDVNYDLAFTATIGAVLPIELTNFTATTEGSKNNLTWSTASEVNNKLFEIERSYDGKAFTSIGQVNGNNKASSYQYVDNAPFNTTYYRLKQIDNDGTETYSKVITATLKGGKTLKVYPTLVSNGLLTVSLRGDEATEGGDFAIYNVFGQQVQSGKTTQRLDVSALAKGTYILKVGTEQAKFVKQ